MIVPVLFLALSLPCARAVAGDPLLDLTVQGYGGAGYAVTRGEGVDILGRAGGALTGWITPRVGLGVRADRGNYGLLDDDPNAFVFAEGRYRLPDQDMAIGLGVGSPLAWVEYYCDVSAGPCVEGPWEYHDPIGALSLTWEQGLGPLHLPLALRLEASKVRAGLGVDLGLGWRFRRR
jgi:hypothetical protein